MSATDRVIVLVDMDCFYCQVEQKLDPSLIGKPLAVVQYNAWKGGGLIAVNYEARAKGVTRHMRGDDARKACPEIVLARVPTVRNKADLTRYRDAGKEVAEVLQTFTSLLERASVDEAYLDITEAVNTKLENWSIKAEQLKNSHVVGYEKVEDFLKEISYEGYLNESNVKLAIGGLITEEMRAAVFKKTGYRCSAGVAHNKVLAKLTCGLHKPNQQTILPHEGVPKLYENLSIKKIKSLGGKFGDEVIQKLNITLMADLIKFTERELQQNFDEKTANWLYNIARGINNEPVTVRLVSKSIGCCKRFAGRGALVNEKSVRHWTNELSAEIAERIEKDIAENNRKPRQLIISYSQQIGRKEVSSTRSQALNATEQGKIYQEAYEIIKKNCQRSDGSFAIKFLGLNVSKFEEIKQVTDIATLFKNVSKRNSLGNNNDELDKLAKDIHEVIQAGLELNKSFCNTNNEKHEKENLPSTSKTEIEIKKDLEESDDSSIELEAINCSIKQVDSSPCVVKGKKNSFFNKFLQPAQETPKRDFNTSAILNEIEENLPELSLPSENNQESPNIEKSQVKTQNSILKMFTNNNKSSPIRNPKTFITDDNKELCNECNKLIPVEDIVSHMDYHFAIKLVRDEAHIYKTAVTQSEGITTPVVDKIVASKQDNSRIIQTSKISNKNTNNNNITKNSGRKRKSSNTNRADIANFFVKVENDETTEDNAEVCPNCCKRIKLDEMASHLDYHVAKTLHQELNSMSENLRNNLSQHDQKHKMNKMSKNGDKASGKNGINVNKSKKGTIMTYFKQL